MPLRRHVRSARMKRTKDNLEPPNWLAIYGWLLGHHLVGPTARAKRKHLLRLCKARNHDVFIEAGTYRGATTSFFAKRVNKVISVELHDELFSAAQKRFAQTPNVALVHGDSLVEIPKTVANCPSPPLVFLDGHFSGPGTAEGEVPEPAELTLKKLAGVAPLGTTIVIDDLRLFGSGLAGFPQLDTIAAAARDAFPAATIRIGLDSIVVEV